jgi:putative ABC transport system permease protein
MHLLASTSAGAEPLLGELRRRLPTIGRANVLWTTTFGEYLAQELPIDRVITTVVAGCGVLALVLSTIGVYGMIADTVRRRTGEIGLRVALGARRREIVALVFREGFVMTATGAIAGGVGAVVLSRIVGSFVDRVPLLDLASVGGVALTLGVVVIAAAILPARRALRISPTIALRAE